MHPFRTIGQNVIERVDLGMERSFVLVDGQPVPEQTTAEYVVRQRDPGGAFVVRTMTFARAYDYRARFSPPLSPRDYHRL